MALSILRKAVQISKSNKAITNALLTRSLASDAGVSCNFFVCLSSDHIKFIGCFKGF